MRSEKFEEKANQKEEAYKQAQERMNMELLLQKEMINAQRMQKRRIVERIMRANEYHKNQIMLKIERDNNRLENIEVQRMEVV